MLDSLNVNSESENPNLSSNLSVIERIGWPILILATLAICYFSHLGVIGFVGPDEPRYAWIARDMMETGDWVTPRLYGRPWFEKPPLFYWGAALCFKLFGVSEAAARLPSAISSLLATLAMAWLALRIYGAATARWLLLLLPTTAGMIGFSHAAATDMPFSAMLSLAIVCAAVVLGLTRNENTPILPRTPWLALVLFGFFLGLAVLAKGPAAIVLTGGGVFFWALSSKRWREVFRLLHPVAMASFSATALPWYILCARRNPGFLHVFIIEHNFRRYLTPEFQHIQPFWFYLPVFLVAFLPWTAPFLWSSLTGAIHLWHTRGVKDSLRLLLCWASFCALFFSLSRSKLPGYILPAIPALTLLMSHCVAAKLEIWKKSFRFLTLLAALLFFVLSGLTAALPPNMSQTNLNFAATARLVLALMGVSNLLLAIFYPAPRKSPFYFLGAAAAVLPVFTVILLSPSLLPSLFPLDPSGRAIARELQRKKIPAERLAVANLRRSTHFSLNFYLHSEVADWNAENSTKSYILTQVPSCKSLTPIPFSCQSLPFDEKATGAFLYYVVMPGSAFSPADGRQVQQKE